ncbi:MAG: hypothetical protein HRT88_03505 [Lentisphaeraceae bacterium]|nr:hypothetical protein [Lentisphaeraceae bacterium]
MKHPYQGISLSEDTHVEILFSLMENYKRTNRGRTLDALIAWFDICVTMEFFNEILKDPAKILLSYYQKSKNDLSKQAPNEQLADLLDKNITKYTPYAEYELPGN